MKHWYCIYTKSKYEDHISQWLRNLPEIEVFNPKIKSKKLVRGNLKGVIEGLFPCYIFSRFNPLRYFHMIKYTRGVRRIVGDKSGKPYIVDDEIIERIQSRIKDGYIHIQQPTFTEGDQVIIQHGPFKEFMGIFQKELNACDRVIVLLNTIAYQASVEVEKGFLVRA